MAESDSSDTGQASHNSNEARQNETPNKKLKECDVISMKRAAFFSIVISTAATASCIIVFPAAYLKIQAIQTSLNDELIFCQTATGDLWHQLGRLSYILDEYQLQTQIIPQQHNTAHKNYVDTLKLRRRRDNYVFRFDNNQRSNDFLNSLSPSKQPAPSDSLVNPLHQNWPYNSESSAESAIYDYFNNQPVPKPLPTPTERVKQIIKSSPIGQRPAVRPEDVWSANDVTGYSLPSPGLQTNHPEISYPEFSPKIRTESTNGRQLKHFTNGRKSYFTKRTTVSTTISPLLKRKSGIDELFERSASAIEDLSRLPPYSPVNDIKPSVSGRLPALGQPNSNPPTYVRYVRPVPVPPFPTPIESATFKPLLHANLAGRSNLRPIASAAAAAYAESLPYGGRIVTPQKGTSPTGTPFQNNAHGTGDTKNAVSHHCPCSYGRPGRPGAPGSPGKAGRDGSPGYDGLPGASTSDPRGCLPSCAPGKPGPAGPPGRKGDAGSPGKSAGTVGRTVGRMGVAGPPGRMGPQGLPGKQGPKGVPGHVIYGKGKPGAPGWPGKTGRAGNPGLPGYLTIVPMPGLPGPTGDPGPPGRKGLPGYAGYPGPVGARGHPGQCDHCVLPEIDIGYGTYYG